MARRKQEAAPAPTSTAEATLMVSEFVQIERYKALERLAAEAAIDKIKAQRDQRLAELEAEAKPLFAGLKAWWEAGGKEELAKGKRSAELAGAKIGIRLTPPKVKLPRSFKDADVVAWLKTLHWSRAKDFLRTKIDLDKQAIIKALPADAEALRIFAGAGVSVEQKDEFFIDTGLDEEALKNEITAS
jgi:phage host-nuclease inhibitor protein Gam